MGFRQGQHSSNDLASKDHWLPKNTDYYKNTMWLEDVENTYRGDIQIIHFIVLSSSEDSTDHGNISQNPNNMISLETYHFLLDIHKVMLNFTSTTGLSFQEDCIKVPITRSQLRGHGIEVGCHFYSWLCVIVLK